MRSLRTSFSDVKNKTFDMGMENKNFKRTLRHIKIVMTGKNNRELLWTEKRIAYNMSIAE